MSSDRIRVATSDYAIAQAPQTLVTYGLGSCVAVCLYEKDLRVGALLHIMLPRSSSTNLRPLRFVDTALGTVMTELKGQGVDPANLVAKLAGGAQVFKTFDTTNSLGARNVAAAEDILGQLGITIASKDTGGAAARSLEFDLSTGLVSIFVQ